MPTRIHLLSETLANQIAAGEVIERPAAVVKELVENALDAGARRIEVELLDGGARLVRVRDDGSGMGREDAQLSLQRHATSKLASKDDLFAISSYGFRGEALPSIAAVSRFTLLSCEPGALAGTRIEVEGGRVVSLEEAGAPQGTTVEVRDLFFNVPARRKFLKRASTEQAHAVEAVLRLAVPRADVSFVLREGERTLVRIAPGASLEERAAEALVPEVRGKLFPFDASVRGVRARGLGASPELALSSARAVWLFVNGRAIRDRQLTHAVLRAYGEVIPHGRYPAALVFLEVPPHEVDVNVHPAKAEVRLADGRAAYEAILRGLGAALAPGAWLHLGGSAQVAAARSYALGAGSSADGAGAGGPAAGDSTANNPTASGAGGSRSGAAELLRGAAAAAPGAHAFETGRGGPNDASLDGVRADSGVALGTGEAGGERADGASLAGGGDEELVRIRAEAAGPSAAPPGAQGATAQAGVAYPPPSAGDEHAARVAEALARYGQRMPALEAAAARAWPRAPSEVQRGPTWPLAQGDAQPSLEQLRGAVSPPQQETLLAPQPYFRGLRYLGQLHRTYLVCEGERGLVLIDQHAAHERMNYQRLRRAAGERCVSVQPLLVPRFVQLPAASLVLLAGSAEALLEAGIEVDAFGGGSAVVKALPALLSGLTERALAALLGDLADELSAHGRGESLERLRDAILARAACHGSVRAHDPLAPGEAQALLDALDGTDYGARCAHGRPVVAEWSVPEVEKRFGRDYVSHAHAAPADVL